MQSPRSDQEPRTLPPDDLSKARVMLYPVDPPAFDAPVAPSLTAAGGKGRDAPGPPARIARPAWEDDTLDEPAPPLRRARVWLLGTVPGWATVFVASMVLLVLAAALLPG